MGGGEAQSQFFFNPLTAKIFVEMFFFVFGKFDLFITLRYIPY